MRLEGVIVCKRGDRVRVGERVFLSAGCEFVDDGMIVIDDDVILGADVRIIGGEGGEVNIGRGAWVGDGAELRTGATIGAGAIVCAGSVVEGEVPAYTLVEGKPAKVTWHLR
jgi:acetyltransferase-like isoleucine patch superfamily enzyme